MDSKWLSPFIFHTMLLLSIWISSPVYGRTRVFNVNSFGAISSQKADSNQDFLEAWKKACGTNGGVFTVAEGTYSVSGSLMFQGPCNGKTTVTINGNLKAGSEVTLPGSWIMFYLVNDLTINGNGTLDGNGAVAWGSGGHQRPNLLCFEQVTNAQIQDIGLVNSKMVHIHLDECQHVTIDHVNITAPGDSPNTDGVHMGRSSDINITNSVIATGDDCVSMGAGTTSVSISGVVCGPGHGISIGSLGNGQGEKDVSSITVTNCTLTGTTNGLRIKTWVSSESLAAQNITFQHIIMNNVSKPIIINQEYCDKGVRQCANGLGDSNVQIKGVKFIDVKGSTATQVAVNLDCSASKPCQDIELSGVNLNYNGQPATAACTNADAKFLGAGQIPSKC